MQITTDTDTHTHKYTHTHTHKQTHTHEHVHNTHTHKKTQHTHTHTHSRPHENIKTRQTQMQITTHTHTHTDTHTPWENRPQTNKSLALASRAVYPYRAAESEWPSYGHTQNCKFHIKPEVRYNMPPMPPRTSHRIFQLRIKMHSGLTGGLLDCDLGAGRSVIFIVRHRDASVYGTMSASNIIVRLLSSFPHLSFFQFIKLAAWYDDLGYGETRVIRVLIGNPCCLSDARHTLNCTKHDGTLRLHTHYRLARCTVVFSIGSVNR